MKKGWEMKKLGEVLKIQNGYAFDSKLFSTTGEMPLIRIRDLKKGYGTETKYSGDFDQRYVVKKGDFLIGMDGEFSCFEWKGVDALLNQRVCRLQNFDKALHPKFLFFGINKHLKEIEDFTAFTTVKHISSRQIESIEIPLPPLAEQTRLVAKLETAFAAIEQAKQAAAENLRGARGIFEGFLQGVFEGGGEGWEVKTLPQISENLDSRRIPITKNQRVAGEIPYYGASGIVDYVADFIFDEDLLCVSEDGANLLARTYPIAFSIAGKTWVNNHAHVLRFNNSTTQKFVEIYLNSIKLDDFVSGMAQPKLNQAMLNKIPIPLPPIEQQTALVATLDRLRAETQKLETIYQTKLAALDELKKSILEKAFAGEL